MIIIKSLNEARHLIIVVIKEVVIILIVGVPAEGHDVGAVAKLHVAVAEGSVALEQDLLTRDLFLTRHFANLEKIFEDLR